MKNPIRLATLLACSALPTCLEAGITPHWRINPITPTAIAYNPALASAMSVSLLIDLSGSSLFNVAGLDLSNVTTAYITIFNSVHGSNATRPNSLTFNILPAENFDSYVCVSDPSINETTPASISGRFTGTGPAAFGPVEFNVAWGATPNTGPIGGNNLEIARITLFGGDATRPSLTVVNGQVRSSDAPNTPIAVPPMPTPFIPEPAGAAAVVACVATLNRQRRPR